MREDVRTWPKVNRTLCGENNSPKNDQVDKGTLCAPSAGRRNMAVPQ